MTNKEMTELFSVMMLAWPNAETLKGGITKLAPTIKLWTSCLSDIDFWTAQQALLRLCQKLKFVPTIADLRNEAATVRGEIESQARFHWDMYHLIGKDEYIASFGTHDSGTVKALIESNGNWYKFRDSYFSVFIQRASLSLPTNQTQRRLT